ncbi:MAG: DUF3078 domain-containing protein [Bacteroidales bacterium]|nr:DUF3078 domain-containing protein [Bacteroidales bacterium]
MLKSIMISRKLLLIILLISVFNLYSNAQNQKLDTSSSIRERISENDTINSILLEYDNDSIQDKHIQDTLRRILNIKDTLITNIHKDTLKFTIDSDTIPLTDSIAELNSYDQILNFVKDSLYFDEPDSIHYVIYKLNRSIYNDSVLFNDTTKQAIFKLIDYTRSREIKPVVSYLQSSLINSEPIYEARDSSLKLLRDSIYNAVEYLIKSIPEDSTKFFVINTNNDSISFESAEHETDSIHINLFDNRGENAVLWIKKAETNFYEIYLEDGTYLEKAKLKKVVVQGVDYKIVEPELKGVKKIKMIIPIWKFDGLADIRFNQGYVSESWAEGGESSIAALSILKYSADYTYGKLKDFDSDVEYRLGYIKAGVNGLQKNDDKFELNVKYGTSAFNNWYYSGLLNFKTQFLKGFDYSDSSRTPISELLSPAHLVFSLGLDYKPSSKFTMLISPITSKFTIVADTIKYDQTRFGVDKNEKTRKELGAYVKVISKIKIKDNFSFENKVNFFANYADNPQNIDVDWEIDLVVKLTDYIKMSINAHFIYDDDVKFINKLGEENGAKAQFKELFGIGFIYSF